MNFYCVPNIFWLQNAYFLPDVFSLQNLYIVQKVYSVQNVICVQNVFCVQNFYRVYTLYTIQYLYLYKICTKLWKRAACILCTKYAIFSVCKMCPIVQKMRIMYKIKPDTSTEPVFSYYNHNCLELPTTVPVVLSGPTFCVCSNDKENRTLEHLVVTCGDTL